MRITEQDVKTKVQYLNERLTRRNAKHLIGFSFRYNYYVIEALDAKETIDRGYNVPSGFGVLISGTKKECYDYVCAMLRGIDMFTDFN